MEQKDFWEQNKKARAFEQVMVVISELYRPDAQNIMLALKGKQVAQKPKIKHKMKVADLHVQSQSASGCTDCGDTVVSAVKNFTDLKTVDDVKTYYNVGSNEAYAVGRMKATLKANEKEVPDSDSADVVAPEIIKLVRSGNYLF